MMRWSNNLTTCINICALMVGIGVITIGITMAHSKTSSCYTLLISLYVKLGSAIMVVSLIGLLGSCCRSPFLMWLYLVFYIIFIIVMAVGVILWTIVMIRGHIKLDVGEEYKFRDFASWFKDVIFSMVEMNKVRQCMIDSDLCSMDQQRVKHPLFSITKLKKACCRLPPWCITDPNNATISDCHTWTREKDRICYYCNACIGGFLSQVTELWRKLFRLYATLLFFVIFIFIIGCRAFQQQKADYYKNVCHTTTP